MTKIFFDLDNKYKTIITYPDTTYIKIRACWYKDKLGNETVPVELLHKDGVKYLRFYSGTHPYPTPLSECEGLLSRRLDEELLPTYY